MLSVRGSVRPLHSSNNEIQQHSKESQGVLGQERGQERPQERLKRELKRELKRVPSRESKKSTEWNRRKREYSTQFLDHIKRRTCGYNARKKVFALNLNVYTINKKEGNSNDVKTFLSRMSMQQIKYKYIQNIIDSKYNGIYKAFDNRRIFQQVRLKQKELLKFIHFTFLVRILSFSTLLA